MLAERLRASVAAHPFTLDDGQVLHKTCSIGFACYPPQGRAGQLPDWHDTVEMADQCLYVAKSSGRNLWVGITAQAAAPSQEGGATRDLRAGVESGAIELRWSEGRQIAWAATEPDGGN